MKKAQLLLITFLMIALAGCSHPKMYPGEKLSGQEVAKIITDNESLGVYEIDGEKTYNFFKWLFFYEYPREIEVLPGPHLLSVQYLSKEVTAKASGIPLRTKAGSTYVIHHQFKKDVLTLNIFETDEEGKNKKKVGFFEIKENKARS